MNQAVKDVINSLDSEAGEWSYDHGRFRICNGRVAVWIANNYSGLSIEVDGHDVWGGVSFASCLRLSPAHWRLWRAVERWRKASGSEVGDLLEAKP